MLKFGDISSGNVVGISTDVYNHFENEQYSKITLAHELVHPYVAIPVSKNHPFSAFVVEGFPSFFHLYALEKLEESFDLKKKILRIEKYYLKNKQRKDFPHDKSILEIKFGEIGTYKDKFILSDRVLLFFYDLLVEMGESEFDRFTRELFTFDKIDYNNFEDLILKFIPGYKEKLNIWLNTTDYSVDLQVK